MAYVCCTFIEFFWLDPITTAYIGCPECVSLYDPASLQPSAHCTYVSVKTRAHCRKPLFDPLCTKPTPLLEVLMQPVIPWIGRLLNRPGKEALCQSNANRVANRLEDGMSVFWDSELVVKSMQAMGTDPDCLKLIFS